MSVSLEKLVRHTSNLFCDINFNNIKNIYITGISSHSSQIKPGFLFVAKAGATKNSKNGHDFIGEAISLGACAVVVDKNFFRFQKLHIPVIKSHNSALALAFLCEAFWDFPSSKIKLIGLTGTNGKTSTSFMLHSIFKEANFRPQIIGTLGMGDPEHLVSLSHTTMEPEFLSATLASMCARNISHVIIEASSHGIVLDRVSGLNFACVGLTNISQDHLDFHGSMYEYIKAKQKLFDEIAHEHTYKIMPSNNFFALNLSRQIIYDPTCRPPGLKLLGDFQINNAALAQTIAHALGISQDIIRQGLQKCIPIPGRFELVTNKKPWVFIDYAHTPEALELVLKSARKLTTKRLILVFGCGGDRDQDKRAKMGLIAYEFADIIIISDDNPRSENPEEIRRDIMSGFLKPRKEIHEIADRKEAITRAIISAGIEDVVIIAGKGHENYQVYGTNKLRFSDKEVVDSVLEHL